MEYVQTKVAQGVAAYLSNELETEVSIGRVNINYIDDVTLEDVFVADHRGDTLIFARELFAKVKQYDLKNRKVDFQNISLNEGVFYMKKYENEDHTNLQVLLNYFKSDKPSGKKPFDFSVEDLRLFECRFKFYDYNKPKKDQGIDFAHLDLSKLSGSFSNITQNGNLVEGNIDKLHFKEQSGFQLDYLTANARYSNKQIFLGALNINTPNTDISTQQLSFNYDSPRDFSDFVNKVQMESQLNQSVVHTKDLAYFTPFFQGLDEKVSLSGNVLGTVADLSVNDLDLDFAANTKIKGDIKIVGLPDPDKTVYDANLKTLATTKSDLDRVILPPFVDGKKLELPPSLKSFGRINGTATFKGSTKDFVATTDLKSAGGDIVADLTMHYDTLTHQYRSDGLLQATNLDLGAITGTNTVGRVTTEISLNSSGKDFANMSTNLDARLVDFELMGYRYKEVLVDGVLAQNLFDGEMVIRDPNLDLNFDGKVDFRNALPNFDFSAEVEKLHLRELGFDYDGADAIVCSVLEVKGSGNTIDNFKGQITAKNLNYYANGKDYWLDEIGIYSNDDQYGHEIAISSPFVNLSMSGEFSIDRIPDALYALGGNVLPSVFPESDLIDIENDDFFFDVDILDLATLSELFMPELKIAKHTMLEGEYRTNVQDLTLTLSSDYIEYNGVGMAGIYLETDRFFDVYEFRVMMDQFQVNDSITLDQFEVISQAFEDNIDARIQWGTASSPLKGNIYGEGYWTESQKFYFDIQPIGRNAPSFVQVEQDNWGIDEHAHFSIDSSAIFISNFAFTNTTKSGIEQKIKAHGKISEDPTDRVYLEVANFDLSNLNSIIANPQFSVGGILSGEGNFSNIYEQIQFDNLSDVTHLQFNGYDFGNASVQTSFNSSTQSLEVFGDLTHKGRTGLRIDGDYRFEDVPDKLDFNIELDSLDLQLANAFVPSGVSHLKGISNGKIKLSGKPDFPIFNGQLDFIEAGCTVDLLNTSYSLSGPVTIEPDFIFMSGIQIKDKFGHGATLVDGSFFHTNFRDYAYNFYIDMRKESFLVMNTTYEMNQLYYGDAFVTGEVGVSYDDYNKLEINVQAKSEKGTNVTLPLYGAEEVVLHDFVTFIDRSDTLAVEEETLDLTGINMVFDMELTPDAEIELVFDEIVGDKMSGTGSGNIQMEIDQYDQFKMYGQYEVEQGNYLFTLMDFINKPFTIAKGGTISWYGDPYNADIDLQAVYSTRTSLYDIMPEGEREQYRNNTEVNCLMNLTENLFNPEIRFGVELPRSDETSRAILRNLISSEEELNKQVFALMVLNKFLPRTNAISSASSTVGSSAFSATTSDLLSSQMSNWLNQLSDDFDIGVNAKFGDQVSEDEIAVALSTQFFNDRLELSGNFGYANGINATTNAQNSRLIGDVNIEYKLNKDGTFRVRAFNESNEYDPLQNQSYYTQGLGLYFKESFNNFWEFKHKMLNLFRKEEKEIHHYKGEEGEEGDPF